MTACSEALVSGLVFPIPSLIDCCAIPFRLTFLHPSTTSGRRRLCRHGRSLVDAALRQKRPDDAGCLVGKGDNHKHGWLAGEHSRKPRSLGSTTAACLPCDGAGADDEQ